MNARETIDTTRALGTGDWSLLAMDGSDPTCHKRCAAVGIPQTEEARRDYRGLVFAFDCTVQQPRLELRQGEEAHVRVDEAAHQALYQRAVCNGECKAAMESA